MYHSAWEKSGKRSGEAPLPLHLLAWTTASGRATIDFVMMVPKHENSMPRVSAARAMRSLADSAHRKKEYGKAAEFWEAASGPESSALLRLVLLGALLHPAGGARQGCQGESCPPCSATGECERLVFWALLTMLFVAAAVVVQ